MTEGTLVWNTEALRALASASITPVRLMLEAAADHLDRLEGREAELTELVVALWLNCGDVEGDGDRHKLTTREKELLREIIDAGDDK